MLHSQGLLLHLLPGSTPGFALPLGAFRSQLTGGNITPSSLKTPSISYLGSLQLHLCAVSATLRWLQPCPRWGQPGQGHFSVHGYTVWGKEQQRFLMFLPHSCQSARRPAHSSQGPALDSLPSVLAVSSKAASSQLCICSKHCHPVLLCPAHTQHPCQREKARTQAILWDAELPNLQDPCACLCQRALLTPSSWSGHSGQEREKGRKGHLSFLKERVFKSTSMNNQ